MVQHSMWHINMLLSSPLHVPLHNHSSVKQTVFHRDISVRNITDELSDKQPWDDCVDAQNGVTNQYRCSRNRFMIQKGYWKHSKHAHTNRRQGKDRILNYHCVLFLNDPIILQPLNNYIHWTHSKTEMKCNRRSETVSARLLGLQSGLLVKHPQSAAFFHF